MADDPTDLGGAAPEFRPEQFRLMTALSERDDVLGRMYQGAILTFQSESNPAALAQSAHSLRELIGRLPAVFDVETMSIDPIGKLNAASQRWVDEIGATRCRHDGAWQGCIDPPLARLLGHADSFFHWNEQNRPRRRRDLMSLLQTLTPGADLPEALAGQTTDQLFEVRRYFIKVCHHEQATDRDEFARRLTELETLLLARLRPAATADLTEIDDLIDLGEHS